MNSPLYSITYKVNSKRPYLPSYEILSAFVGQNDVIIELSTDMLMNVQSNVHEYAKKYLDKLNSAFSLEYCSRKVPSAQKPSVLGFLFQTQKKIEADELIIDIPNTIWTDERFMEMLPVHGAKYYITKEPAKDRNILNRIWCMPEEEKGDTFKFILNDYPWYGKMGISVSSLDENELRRLLGLVKKV